MKTANYDGVSAQSPKPKLKPNTDTERSEEAKTGTAASGLSL